MAFTAFKLQTFLTNFVKNLQKQTTLPDPRIKSLKSFFSGHLPFKLLLLITYLSNFTRSKLIRFNLEVFHFFFFYNQPL